MQATDTRRNRYLVILVSIAAGAAAAWIVPASMRQLAVGAQESSGAERRLSELKLELPPVPEPVAVYVPAVRVDNVLYVSGTGPRRASGQYIQGKVGRDLTIPEGKAAARLVGLNVLSSVRAKLGSLDKVVRLVKVLGMVNCTPDFKSQPQVINGFSELMVEVFGEKAGRGARSAVGMGSLPSAIAVEIEAIFQVRD